MESESKLKGAIIYVAIYDIIVQIHSNSNI